MSDAAQPLEELKQALDSLPPHDLAAWTALVESRLTERLRQRQEHRPAPPEIPVEAGVSEPAPPDKEYHDA